MRHLKRTAKLGRTSEHRNAMLANLVCSLIEHKRVTTISGQGQGRPFRRRKDGHARQEGHASNIAASPSPASIRKRPPRLCSQKSLHTVMPKKLAEALMEAGMKHFDVGGAMGEPITVAMVHSILRWALVVTGSIVS